MAEKAGPPILIRVCCSTVKRREPFVMTKMMRLLVGIAVAIAICSLCACSPKAVTVENGMINLEGTTVNFGENNVPDGDSASLKIIKATDTETENGLCSKLFELALTEAYTQPVTVTLPVPEDYSGEAEEALLVGLGIECEYDSGKVGTEYFYFPAEVAEGTASVSFIPAELAEAPLYMGASQGTAAAKKMKTSISLKCGLFSSVSYFEEGGHFRLYYPMKVEGKFFHDIVGTSGREAILSDLEAVYEKYKALGYQYDEDDFPMNVLVKKIDDAGSYHMLYGDITLNVGNFTEEYVPGSLNPLLGHEFFHYVQGCYTGIFAGSDWVDEATASYYEARAQGQTYTSLTSQYFERQFVGALPPEDTAQDGYARSPLISFLSQRKGSDAWIKTAYENGGTQEALIAAVGDPSGWAHEYYTALASGKVGQEGAYILHKNLRTGVYGADVGTTLKLRILNANDLAQKAKGEEIVLGSSTVKMNGQGCRLVAITVDADDLKKLPDGANPKVECQGASVTVISAEGRNVQNCGSSLSGLKDSADSQIVYLVVVTSQAGAGVSGSFDVKIILPEEKIDFSGVYTGVLHVTETGADIDVTTVVTFERDFGDGAYYKIVCSNDATGSTYINNSYFVRSTGEANIAGAVFTFSADGQSFYATMLDFNNKAWGTISAYK